MVTASDVTAFQYVRLNCMVNRSVTKDAWLQFRPFLGPSDTD